MKLIDLLVALLVFMAFNEVTGQEKFPDGSPISDWFYNTEVIDIDNLGKKYRVTDFGVNNDSTLIQTEKIQAVIDIVHEEGGGVVIIPKGTFLSGSLFFRPKTHLYLEKGAVLKGSDDISDFKLHKTRIEGQTINYFAALINANEVNGFTISGQGTLNGNGLRFWKSFWLRRQFDPETTNLAEMRPRLLYVSNSKDVQISGIHLKDSPFWTSHFYRCHNLKLLNLRITAPKEPVKAPSSDGIDLDVCENVLIKNSFISVNDDAIALKGGKGPNADKDPNNGGNRNIIIENNKIGFSHSALTLGSESIYNNNIIFKNNIVNGSKRLLWLKMRPDTPQKYENILIEDIEGAADDLILIKPWTQFFDLKGGEEIRKSTANRIVMRNIKMTVDNVFNVEESDQYTLSDFTFDNLNITAKKNKDIDQDIITSFSIKDVTVNGGEIKQE